MKKCMSAVLAALFLYCTGPAYADVVYSNYGPGGAFQYGIGLGLLDGRPECAGCPEQPLHTYVGNAFTPHRTNYRLDSLELTGWLVTGPNELDLFLVMDASGKPGELIEAFHLSGVIPLSNSESKLPLVAQSALHPVLREETQYWLVASVSGPDALFAWNFDTTDGEGLEAHACVGPGAGACSPWAQGDWYVVHQPKRTVFRVSGTPIPEPRTAVLLSIGVTCLLAFARPGLQKLSR